MYIPDVLSVSALLDGTVAAVLLFTPWRPMRGWHRPVVIDLRRTIIALLVTTALFAVKLSWLKREGILSFGAMWGLYVGTVVVLPVMAAIVLCVAWLGRRPGSIWRVTRAVQWLAGFCLVPAPLGFYATYIEPFALRTERATVSLPAERSGSQPITVGVIADLQFREVTDYEHMAIDRMMSLHPDVILLAGDLYQGPVSDFDMEAPFIRHLLGKLSAPGGVYSVRGNVDHPDVLRASFAGTSVQLLMNETRRVTVRDRQLTLAGLNWPPDSPGSRAMITEMEQKPGAEDIRILLSHAPDAALLLSPGGSQRSRIDLIAAGHTHGGQIQIPFIGPIVTFSQVPKRIAGGGLHWLNGAQLYIGRGVGCERGQAPQVRFCAPPEIALLTLTGRPG